jgi:hypothetical protein
MSVFSARRQNTLVKIAAPVQLAGLKMLQILDAAILSPL